MFLKCRSKAYIISAMKFDLHNRQILVLSKRRISVQILLLSRGKQRAYEAFFFLSFFSVRQFFFLTSKNFQSVRQLSGSCFEVFAKTGVATSSTSLEGFKHV